MINTSKEQFALWLNKPEGLNLEFKKAENSFSEAKDLPDYCAALANEGGGKLILGVTDNRQVLGTKAFTNTVHTLSNKLLANLHIRVDIEELEYLDKRILIFHIPSRGIASIVSSTGNYKYPMRAGSSIVEMNQDNMRKIYGEAVTDFSAQIVSEFSVGDIDEQAITIFKGLWAKKQQNPDYENFSTKKTLRSIGALSDKGCNYACLLLFGKKELIDRILPGAEIIYEWRQENKIMHDFRREWRAPFFTIFDEIWRIVDSKNIRYPFQQGFIQREVYAFNEKSVREAVLNAVTHRDYSIDTSSIFIKASPNEFVIRSPGSFLSGINENNALQSVAWRNRRIAEIFQLAGLVERAGQGLDTIYQNTISEGKGLPDFTNSDDRSVNLHIPALVQDENFILFLEKLANEKHISLSFEEILELENVRKNQQIGSLKYRNKFLETGIIEKIGNTSGTNYILSQRYYKFKGKPGLHTKIVGLSRKKCKELIILHLKNNKGGARNTDFRDALNLKQNSVNNLLQELKLEKRAIFIGSKTSGRWHLIS